MGYQQLNYLKRCKIQAFWKAGYTEQKIADEVGVHKSTISREFSRNMTFVRTKYGYWTYKADYAQTYAENRKKNKNYPIKFNESVEEFVREKLIEDWSPEQISGYAAKNRGIFLSGTHVETCVEDSQLLKLMQEGDDRTIPIPGEYDYNSEENRQLIVPLIQNTLRRPN